MMKGNRKKWVKTAMWAGALLPIAFVGYKWLSYQSFKKQVGARAPKYFGTYLVLSCTGGLSDFVKNNTDGAQ